MAALFCRRVTVMDRSRWIALTLVLLGGVASAAVAQEARLPGAVDAAAPVDSPVLPATGLPPVEVAAPPLALSGLETELRLNATAPLPVASCAVAVFAPDGESLAEGRVESDGSTTLLRIRPRASGSFEVRLPACYTEPSAFEMRVVPAWTSLLPPALAILLALLFRQVIPALVAGVWAGAWLVYQGPFGGALRTLDHYVIGSLGDPDRVAIIVFSLTLGGMVGVLSRSGGTIGLVEALAPYATTSRRGQLVSWLMGLVIFFDDYANTLLVGNTMRPVTDRLRVSREKLAYIVDSTAAPVASIALVSTWIGYEVSLIAESLKTIGSDLDPYAVFIRALPFNFYPVLALWFGLLIAATQRDFGPMARAEARAATGKLLADGAIPLADFDGDALQAAEGKPRRWINAVLPVLVVLGVTFAGLWFTGRAELAAEGQTRGQESLFQWVGNVFGAGDSFKALLWASMAGSLAALALAVGQRILTLNDGVSAWINGVKSMMMAVVILVLAWSIADVCTDLNTRGFMVASLSESLDPRLLPGLVFLLAAVTAFATGTSWGTMGILIPLAVPTAHGLAQGLGPAVDQQVLFGSVSAVLAGAIFGDHCSPISDTTVMSSMASGCDHVDHVRTQLPYALIVAAAALLLGYLPAGYGVSPWLCLPVGAAGLALALAVLNRASRRATGS